MNLTIEMSSAQRTLGTLPLSSAEYMPSMRSVESIGIASRTTLMTSLCGDVQSDIDDQKMEERTASHPLLPPV